MENKASNQSLLTATLTFLGLLLILALGLFAVYGAIREH